MRRRLLIIWHSILFRLRHGAKISVQSWVAGLVILWICVITGVSGWGYQRQERIIKDQQEEAISRRESACEDGDDSRAIIRQMSKDSALEVGEALIEVAGGDADPEVIAQFRQVINRRLDTIVNQLPSRRWNPAKQECVDVMETG